VRFIVFFLVMFGITMAAFAVARALGLHNASWHDAYLGAAAIAAALTVVSLFANKGTSRLPTSK
jgi:hypothetical protein